jgi:hypothetical protein
MVTPAAPTNAPKYLQFKFHNMPLESDTGWKYTSWANPGRGLHDYERTIVFKGLLSEREETKLQDAIKLLDNPGYCNWSFRKQPDGLTYKLTSTLDSSD